MPRFQGDNLAANLAQLAAVERIAAAKGVSTAAVAIALVLSRGDDIVAIPGCKRRETLKDTLNAAGVSLSADDLKTIDEGFDPAAISGTRYPEGGMKRVGL